MAITKWLRSANLALIGLGGVLLGSAGTWWLLRPPPGTGDQDNPEVIPVAADLSPPASAHVAVVPVERRSIQPLITVPGRLRYNDTRRVELKASTDCVLREVLVRPGDRVAVGQTLAVLSSPEVGAARAEVLKRRDEQALAEQKYAWEQQAYDNTLVLLDLLKSRTPISEVEAAFRDRVIGEHREELLTAYSRYLLAEMMLTNARPLAQSGTLPEATLRQRESERQVTEAALRALCEQAEFTARQDRDQARLLAEDARRRVEVGQNSLTALLGYEDAGPTAAPDSPSLSLAELRSPMAGTVEKRFFAASERVQRGDVVLLLADTTTLWLGAEIREQDWLNVQVTAAQELTVRFPGRPDQAVTAKVLFAAREATPEINAIAIVAELDNSTGQYRPGMFARTEVPAGPAVECLVVPASCVVQHEGQPFVFVQASPGKYRRQDVVRGREQGDWLEIADGLEAGEQVVKEGAFLLKSTLLLESEAE